MTDIASVMSAASPIPASQDLNCVLNSSQLLPTDLSRLFDTDPSSHDQFDYQVNPALGVDVADRQTNAIDFDHLLSGHHSHSPQPNNVDQSTTPNDEFPDLDDAYQLPIFNDADDTPVLFNVDQLPNPSSVDFTWLTQDFASGRANGKDFEFESRYELRSSARNNAPLPTTWIDCDDSGTYNPLATESNALRIPAKRRKTSFPSNENQPLDQEHPNKKSKPCSWLAGRQQGVCFVVTLKLSSAEGKALLQKLPDNWPEEEWNFFTNSGFASFASSSSEDSPTAVSCDPAYPFRSLFGSSQSNLRAYRQLGQYGREDDQVDLIGHPEARGCKGCYELRQKCPLLEPDSTYPCYTCIEDDCDCELLLPPNRKRQCENCNRRNLKCSYALTNWGIHSEPCYHCAYSKRHCVAGPVVDPTRRRLPNGPNSKLDNAQSPQSPIACASCRSVRKWCSLQNVTDKPPCQLCSTEGKDCVLDRELQQKSKSGQPQEHRSGAFSSSVSGNQTTTDGSPQTLEGKELELGETRVINTKLAHPIVFHYEPPSNGTKPCHWCSQPFHGIFGLEERTVKVVERTDGGYIEVSGGHTASGCEPSRICVDHTWERVLIVICQGHRLKRIKGFRSDAQDYEAACIRLVESTDSKKLRETDKWCSVCPQLAKYECCREQPVDTTEQGIARHGCGLHLCGVCAITLAQTYANDLQAMIARMDGKDEYYEHGLRADVGFLAEKGPLVKYYRSLQQRCDQEIGH